MECLEEDRLSSNMVPYGTQLVRNRPLKNFADDSAKQLRFEVAALLRTTLLSDSSAGLNTTMSSRAHLPLGKLAQWQRETLKRALQDLRHDYDASR